MALGSDQAPGNNSHNIFSEMRATAMYPKIRAEHPLAIPSWQVLRSATIEGAEVLGVADRVGSLEVGKEADLIFLDLTRPPLAPVLLRPARNLVANLVYAETGRERDALHGGGQVIYATAASPTWTPSGCSATCGPPPIGCSALPPPTSARATCPSWT